MLRKKFSLKKQKKNKNLRGGALHSELTGPMPSTGKMKPAPASTSPPPSPLSQSHFKLPSRTVSDNSAPPSSTSENTPTLSKKQLNALNGLGNPEEVINMIKRGRKLLKQQNRLIKSASVRGRSVPPGMGLG